MTAEVKPICGMERVVLSEVVPLDTPFTVFIFPTTYCNFKCHYCGHSLGLDKMKELYDFKPENMKMVDYSIIINQLKEFPQKLKVLSLTGHGEPLLNPDIPDMVKIANENNVAEQVEIITNASLLTPHMSDALIDAGLDVIRISLQGMTSDTYSESCKYDLNFDELVKNIRYFYERRGKCRVYVKIMDVVLKEGEENLFYATFQNICDRMFVEKCKPVYAGVEYEGDITSLTDRYGRVHEKREVCPLPFFMLGIFPNGDVEPCDTIYKPVILGNIQKSTLQEMWHGERLREFRRLHLEKRRCRNEKCGLCCAPDDVAHPEDCLDDAASLIIKRI